MIDIDSPHGSLVLLTRLAKIVYRRSSEQLLGMTLRHFVMLSYLRDHPIAPQHDLADVLCMDANNLVLLLNELEAADLAQRRRDPADRRRHLVQLTSAGEEALRRAEEAQERIEEAILATLSAEDRATLRRLLACALAGVEPRAGAGAGAGAGGSEVRAGVESRAGASEVRGSGSEPAHAITL
ncbi:MAG: MarR family winged helix-turn-helix transcriptional regulator [Solirubrobacteraceae bacterium]